MMSTSYSRRDLHEAYFPPDANDDDGIAADLRCAGSCPNRDRGARGARLPAVQPGAEFDLTIQIDDVVNLYAYDITLQLPAR